MFSGESELPDYRVSDYSISPSIVDNPRHLHLPAYVIRGPAEKLIKRYDDPAQILAGKTKFCSFVVSTYNPHKNQNRPDFFDLLSRYKQVDSAGRLRNNIGRVLPRGAQGQGGVFASLQIQHLF